MSNHLRTLECFMCDQMFSKEASIEAGTPEKAAGMYCSPECFEADADMHEGMLKNTEDMENHIQDSVSTYNNSETIKQSFRIGMKISSS